MSEYSLKYQPTPEMLNRAMVAWTKPQRSRREKWKGFAFGAIAYVVLCAAVVALLQLDLVTNQVLFGLGLGMIVMIALWAMIARKHMNKLRGFSHAAMARHGETDAVFRADRVEITSQISSAQFGWLCFDEVSALSDATVLRSGAVIYAVPDAALPDDVTPSQFRADLQSWMEDAR